MSVSMLFLSALLVWAPPEGEAATPPTDDQVRAAIQRSLAFTNKGSVEWRDNRKCVTCHRVAMDVWTHNEAKRRGIDLHAESTAQLFDWSLDFCKTNKYEEKFTGGFIQTMNQMILSQQFSSPSDKAVQTFEFFIPIYAREQLPDGAFKQGNQLKRPTAAEREANEVDTMWTLLALNAMKPMEACFTEESRLALGKQRVAAHLFLKDAKPGERTDWFSLQLLLAKSENKPDGIPALRQELLSRQNADGGWGFVKTEDSHVTVTGETLFALVQSGLEPNHPAVQKARQFLVKMQLEDGSWEAISRRSPPKANEINQYWATCWAAQGLLQTLPLVESAK